MDEAIIAKLIAHGQTTGALTYDEVNAVFPELEPERLVELCERLESHEITIICDEDSDSVLPSPAPEVMRVLQGFVDDGAGFERGFYPHPPFEELLRRHVIPFDKFGCTMSDAFTIHSARLRVPGEQALQSWWKLRQLAPETGLWPVIVGFRTGRLHVWQDTDELPVTRFVDAIGHREAAKSQFLNLGGLGVTSASDGAGGVALGQLPQTHVHR